MAVANTRARYVAGVLTEFDSLTQETVFPSSPIFFDEDFIGARGTVFPATATPGEPWIKKIVGAAPPTVGAVSNAGAGIVQLALAATSEKEDAVLYFGDQLTFDVTKALSWEARVQMPVLPSVAGVEATFGIMSSWIDGPDNNTYYLRFNCSGSGLVRAQTKDGVNTNSANTSLTFGTADWHNFRIDASVLTGIIFYIDGAQVTLPSAFAFAAVAPNSVLQPYFSMYKPSGTGVGSMNVDVCKVWCNRV
jgi:hypothetical protein